MKEGRNQAFFLPFLYKQLLLSRPVISDSLRPHGLQHARRPPPSPSPAVCPSSYPFHRWCHPAISSSDARSSFCPQSFPALGTVKKAECQRIDGFGLWCWRRLPRVPWTARKSNQWILKKINSEYSLERLMLKLKLQYFGHLMWTVGSLEKSWIWTALLGKQNLGEGKAHFQRNSATRKWRRNDRIRISPPVIELEWDL